MDGIALLIELVVSIASELVPAQKTFGQYVLRVLFKAILIAGAAVLVFIGAFVVLAVCSHLFSP